LRWGQCGQGIGFAQGGKLRGRGIRTRPGDGLALNLEEYDTASLCWVLAPTSRKAMSSKGQRGCFSIPVGEELIGRVIDRWKAFG